MVRAGFGRGFTYADQDQFLRHRKPFKVRGNYVPLGHTPFQFHNAAFLRVVILVNGH